MINSKNYWQKIKLKNSHTTANISLFRFLGEYGFKFKNKKVLELGFWSGANLIEFYKRKSNAYGIDINLEAVLLLSKIIKKKLKQADLRKDKIPFKEKFDLIYSNDFIYYLKKDELQFHFESIHKSLKRGGMYLFQFIENDFVFPKKNFSYDFSKRKYIKKFSEKSNPITFYKLEYFEKIIKKFKFNLIGKKFLIESYGINEKKVRISKYLLISK
jgi:hypothetical protein